jgi:hypothetical protein
VTPLSFKFYNGIEGFCREPVTEREALGRNSTSMW